MIYLIWLPLLVVPFFLFIVLPQRRQLQSAQAMQARLTEGDEVITTSGIYGKVVALSVDDADLEVAPGTVIRIVRRAIGRRVADLNPPAPRPSES